MGKIYAQKINDFSKGITNDVRKKDSRYAQMIKSFDAHTYTHKLEPFRSSESADTIPDTRKAVNFLYANSRLYALGVVSGTSRAEINYKDTADIGGTGWTSPSNGQSSAGSRNENFFIEYKNYIYGARAGTTLWRHGDITGSPTWSDSWQSLTHTNMEQGLVHSKDDILYIPYDNKIAKWDNTTFTSAALTLPTDRRITSICEYGNYLAIATKPLSGVGKSVVYLWDRDSTILTTISESIIWGDEDLKVLEVIDGILIGISIKTSSAGNSTFKKEIIFRYLSGSIPIVFQRLIADVSTTLTLDTAKQKVGSYLYFLLLITIDGVRQAGVWKVGKSASGAFSVTLDNVPNNDTGVTSSVTLEGFFIIGSFVFIAYIDTTSELTSTNDVETYSVSATYESLKFGEATQNKKLISVGVTTEYLPSGGQIILKYKKDSETTWTTIFTHTTANSLFHEAVNIESSGANLPTFREIQFQILSTGGAVITGLIFKYEEIADGLT